jgi:stage V sporulation protein D (sporulation-specific penicillin-binding protein)
MHAARESNTQTRSTHRGQPKPESTYRPQRQRLQWANLFIVFSLVVVSGRLVQLQLVSANYYRETLSPQLLAQPRTGAAVPGALLARDGSELARSIYSYTVTANPARIDAGKQSISVVASQLGPLIGVDVAQLQKRLEERKGRQYAVLKQWLDVDLVPAVRAAGIDGINLVPSYRRTYPHGTLACHILGTRNQFHVPLSGLEHRYRLLLDGKPSATASVSNNPSSAALGQDDSMLPAIAGFDIVLTLDLALQRYVDAAMDELCQRETPKNACAIVMDPTNGDILAMASRPAFDPEQQPLGNERRKATQALSEDNSSNVAVETEYEPGSTMKVLLAAAALDSGISPSVTHYCTGRYDAGGQPINCWGRYRVEGHGSVDMQHMIAMSCNVAAAKIALELGPQKYLEFLQKAGLGQPPGAGFPAEATGSVVRKEWLDKDAVSSGANRLVINAKAISRRDVAVMGFGQGLSCSALQLTSAVSALANGGVRNRPRIIRQILNKDGTVFRTPTQPAPVQLCSPQTAKTVLRMMIAAVERGTAKVAAIDGVQVAAKTGTAQIWDRQEGRFHASRHLTSFILVCPADQPRFVVYVAADGAKAGAHGSDVAGPTARDIASFALRQLLVSQSATATPQLQP